MNTGSILIVPLGQVPKGLLLQMAEALRDRLGCQVTIRDALPLEGEWFQERRSQYMGTELLRALENVSRQDHEYVLGFADVDCYASGLNFIFGQASTRSRAAFVALPRLRPSFYGQHEDQEVFFERVFKETLHELGHTWGLGHCDSPRCVMRFSNTLADTDAKSAAFCESCQRQLLPRR